MNKQTDEWFKQSDYDLATAEAMLRSRRYIYTVFLCHLCLEKALKGLLARQGQAPLRSHDLIFLSAKVAESVPERHSAFLEMLNEVSVPTRYPDELDRLLVQYPRKRAVEILEQSREVHAWLKSCC